MQHAALSVQLIACALLALTALTSSAAQQSQADLAAIDAINKTLGEFDAVRALTTRSLMRAQDLKLAYLYGRSWGLDMPESIPEDVLVEGLWVFDYLDGMDLSSSSLVSYGIATKHPNLQAELETFRSFLPEAAAMALANRPFFGCGCIGQAQDLLEQPDILLGSRNTSHYIARYAVTMSTNNTMPLPFMATGQFPGAGRAIVVLTRPFTRLWSPGRPAMNETELFRERDEPQTLVIAASDAAGLAGGVAELVKLLPAR
jgi:hypothetical protein